MDVFPLQAPVQSGHHHGRVHAAGQCRCRRGIVAAGVADLQIRRRLLQPGQGGDHSAGIRARVRGAAIAQVRFGCQPADHRQGAQPLEGQHGKVMAQQHDRLAGRFPSEVPMGGAATQACRIGPRRHAQAGAQLPPQSVIDAPRRQSAIRQGLGQAALEHHPKWHLQVQTSQQCRQAIADAEDEIAHHKAGKAPALLEDPCEQVLVLAAPDTVDAVVGAHHRAGAGLHTGTELRQIQLVQHPLAGLHIHQEAGAVDGIEGEMLDAGDRVQLQAARHRRAHGAHMQGVLAIGFLGTSPAWVAQQIDAHRRHPVGTEGSCLQGDGLSDLLLKLGIPAGAPGHRHRKGGGTTVEHHPSRTVHELQVRHWQPWPACRRPGLPMRGILQSNGEHPRPERCGPSQQCQPLADAELVQQRLRLRIAAVPVVLGIAHTRTVGRSSAADGGAQTIAL